MNISRVAQFCITAFVFLIAGIYLERGNNRDNAYADDTPKRPRPMKDKEKDDEGPPVATQKVEQPKDGVVYVWPLPAQGHQSLVVLNVVDGSTIDAAFLVPTRIRLKGINVPGTDTKSGKEAQAYLEKQLGGQLRTAQLWGGDPKGGGILGDFWIAPAKEGEKGRWVTDMMLKEKHATTSK